jgi:hypothetical protein
MDLAVSVTFYSRPVIGEFRWWKQGQVRGIILNIFRFRNHIESSPAGGEEL